MLTRTLTAEKNGIKKSTLATLDANREKILEADQKKNSDRDRKQMWASAQLDADKAVQDQQNVESELASKQSPNQLKSSVICR